VLKLTHSIGWSWWFVTMPFWGPVGLFVLIMVFGGLLYGFAALMQAVLK